MFSRPAGVFVDPKPDGPHGVGWPEVFMVGMAEHGLTKLSLRGWLVGEFFHDFLTSHFGSTGLVYLIIFAYTLLSKQRFYCRTLALFRCKTSGQCREDSKNRPPTKGRGRIR